MSVVWKTVVVSVWSPLAKAAVRVLAITAATAGLLPATMIPGTAAAAAGDIWRWQDAQGVVHYGDGPPPPGAVDARRMTPAAAVDPREQAAAKARADRLQRNQDLERQVLAERAQRQAQTDAQASGLAKELASRCRRAQHNVVAFQRGAPVFVEADDGSRHFLSDPERAAQLAQAQAEVAATCGGDGQ